MNRLRLCVILSSFAAVLFHATLYAGTPSEKIRGIMEEVMAIQTDPRLQGERDMRKASIQKIIARNFDLRAMAKEALGLYWQKLDGKQGAEFEAVFEDLFQDSYTRLVLDFLGKEKVLYDKEEVRDRRAVVETTIMRPKERIEVVYSLAPEMDDWLIRDVVIDGVSIVGNYNRSFSRVIKRESYQSLIEKMRLQQKSIEQP